MIWSRTVGVASRVSVTVKAATVRARVRKLRPVSVNQSKKGKL